jgi:hypothetical protein
MFSVYGWLSTPREIARQRIKMVDGKLRTLWEEVRRVRATRRVQLEEALGIDPALTANRARRSISIDLRKGRR